MTGPIPSAAVVSAWARLMRAQRIALQKVEADLKSANLPPLGWYDALLELKRAGAPGIRPVELERRLLLAQHNVSRLIDRLESAGHVERRACDEDGRGQKLLLTTQGLDLLERMWPVYRRAIQDHVGSKLDTDANASALADLLGRLTDEAADR
jgi:DNA-binding MarR family transcriptional regulator